MVIAPVSPPESSALLSSTDQHTGQLDFSSECDHPSRRRRDQMHEGATVPAAMHLLAVKKSSETLSNGTQFRRRVDYPLASSARLRPLDRFANLRLRHSAFANDRPIRSAQRHNRGRQRRPRRAAIENQRQPVAKLLQQRPRVAARRKSERFALVPVIGPPAASINAHATADFGQRSATRPLFPVTFNGNPCVASTTIVNAPGQNFCASFRKLSGKSRASVVACSIEFTKIGSAFVSARPFTRNTRSIAAKL